MPVAREQGDASVQTVCAASDYISFVENIDSSLSIPSSKGRLVDKDFKFENKIEAALWSIYAMMRYKLECDASSDANFDISTFPELSPDENISDFLIRFSTYIESISRKHTQPLFPVQCLGPFFKPTKNIESVVPLFNYYHLNFFKDGSIGDGPQPLPSQKTEPNFKKMPTIDERSNGVVVAPTYPPPPI